MTAFTVAVDVATVWTSPEAPRPVDAPALADFPDLAAWLGAMDPRARLGLHGRTLTQLLRGEPVELVSDGTPGWTKVAAPWQPSPDDRRGYRGWVRSAHLQPDSGQAEVHHTVAPSEDLAADSASVLAAARRFVGLRYLWGGTSPWGFDCSGLVHYCHRGAGIVVPRDASAQQQAALPVPLGTELPGDLYFFGAGDEIDHVGFVTAEGRMLHAPESAGDRQVGDGRIEEGLLAPRRRESLVCAGRFLPS
jgi:gamma-D-glutamyl-L-lysine dipeptidyl-peptidase